MIFCVEDDIGIRDLMIYALNSACYEAKGLSNGAELAAELESRLPDLIILDIMLPGEDGISILKRLRRDPRTEQVPVIIASARGLEYDKVTGLDSGADDYLVKPFGIAEMISRVKAVLRRLNRAVQPMTLKCGKIELDETSHKVSVDGERVILTLKEYELLSLFMNHPGMVLDRERLLNLVWGENYLGETRTVDVHIGTLRSKLGECGELIRTVRGVGYKLEENNDC